MGQKINPNGFRVGITQKHKSIWFSRPFTYSSVLKEDIIIRKFLLSQLNSFNIDVINIKRKQTDFYKKSHIFIEISSYSSASWSKLDIKTIEKVRLLTSLKLRSVLGITRKVFLSVKKISDPNSHSNLIVQDIVSQLEKRAAYRFVIKSAILKARESGVNGIKIQISGRLNGIEIARKEWSREGRVPLHTLNANINYSCASALTVFGLLGVKVWVYQSVLK